MVTALSLCTCIPNQLSCSLSVCVYLSLSVPLSSSLETTSQDDPLQPCHQLIPSTPDLTQTGGSEATQPLANKPPEEIFKEALKNHNWNEVHSILENSLALFCTDTGGQPEFQEVLPALIAGPSVFMLVFRVTDQLDEKFQFQYVQSADQKSASYKSSFTLKETVLQSLASIASITTTFKGIDKDRVASIKPKVLLVATHKDQAPPQRILELQRELMELLSSTEFYRKNIIEFASENTPAFVVNNLSDDQDDHQLIRSAVEKITSNPLYRVDTPAPWLVLGLALRHLGVEAIPYDQCFSIGKDCGISTKEQLNEALWFLHVKLGLIRYFHDVSELQDVIILKPQIIFGKITELIAETFQFARTGQHAQDVFKKNGIFSSNAIEELSQLSNELLPVPKVVKLLEHLHILAPIQKDDGVHYFLPCVLTHADESPLEAPSHEGAIPPGSQSSRRHSFLDILKHPSVKGFRSLFRRSKATASRLILAFRCGYCPKGIFSALVAYLLSQKNDDLLWDLYEDALFRDQVHFYVGKLCHEVTIRMCLTHLEVSAEETQIRAHRGKTKLHQLCNSIREALAKAVLAISQSLHYSSSAAVQIGFHCTHPACTGNPQHTAVSDGPHPETMKCKKTSRWMALSPSELVWFGVPLVSMCHLI